MQMQTAIALAVAAATDTRDAYCRALQAIATGLGWCLGAAWEPTEPSSGTLRCVALWAADNDALASFASVTRTLALAPGEGLPGRVWESQAPLWVTDAATEAGLPRRALAQAAGLHSAICFPVRSERGVIGVVEVFGDRSLVADAELLAMLDLLGVQLGQLVERRRAEDMSHVVQQRHRATLLAALDCVVTMDAAGKVLEFNPAAERTFGYTTEAAVGRDMADLIVPEDLRESHRQGLGRYLADGVPHMLDRRIETEAVRADGVTFPVELTITRIDVPGPPTFTGQIRDITERLGAEAELKASRARIIDAGDEARRQIERDLHDGAQQQLVSVAMNLRVAHELIDGDPAGAGELLREAAGDLAEAIAELRELARGIHPAVLTDGGLDPALHSLARRSVTPTIVVAVPSERLAAAVEAAAYFVVAEGLTNAARYASASRIEVEVSKIKERLIVEIRDDGVGGARGDGDGLRGLVDRLAVLDGSLTIDSDAGRGTTVRAEVPCVS
jgi:PAS domain S-box-containing protein